MVSVTTGQGTSLIAPSNSRNNMTRPLRTRPSQSAGFETGAFSAIVGMALSLKIGDAQSKDERRGRHSTGGDNIFSAFRDETSVASAAQKMGCVLCVLISVAKLPATHS